MVGEGWRLGCLVQVFDCSPHLFRGKLVKKGHNQDVSIKFCSVADYLGRRNVSTK